jgi:dipeptidyl-peptidase-4
VRWALALALGGAVAAAPGASARAQWVPYDQLPGAARVREVEGALRGGTGAGRVGAVRWDLAGGALWFEYAGRWRSVPIAGGTPEAGGEPPAPPAKDDDGGYREPKGARGTQAAAVPSPNGEWIAVFRDSNVVLEPGPGGANAAIRVTTEGSGKLKYGAADWVYAEELDQNTAMWWAPDSGRLAYYAFDERPVKDYVLLGGLTETRTRPMVSGYPKPGDDNGIARLEIFDLASRRRIPVDVGPDEAQYVYGVRWTPRGDGLLFLRTNRRQDTLELVLANPASGETRVVLRETQPTWQNNSPTLRFLGDGRRFIWETEANGFANFQLWSLDGGKIADLTRDPFVAEGIVLVDEDAGWLYYTARSSPTRINSQLHRVRLDGTGGERLTREDRHWSGFQIAPDHGAFVATKEFVDTPPQTALYGMDGVERAVLAKGAADFHAKRGLAPPEFLRIPAADGGEELYGVLFRPSNYDPTRAYPLVVETYGGPGVGTMSGRFQAGSAETEFGVLVARVDNRGTPGRGKAFESATYLGLGGKDVDDQAQLVRTLIARGLVAPGRVGITGHSYGGYMTLMCLLRYPDLYQVGVAGAPPVDWRQYDTIYTERYMRTPAENPEGYDRGSAVRLARNLKGQVLLVHGMVDDNVHPANTFALANEWQRANIPFEMMLFPNSAHGIFSPAYRSQQWSFLLRGLGVWTPETPVARRAAEPAAPAATSAPAPPAGASGAASTPAAPAP